MGVDAEKSPIVLVLEIMQDLSGEGLVAAGVRRRGGVGRLVVGCHGGGVFFHLGIAWLFSVLGLGVEGLRGVDTFCVCIFLETLGCYSLRVRCMIDTLPARCMCRYLGFYLNWLYVSSLNHWAEHTSRPVGKGANRARCGMECICTEYR